MSITVAGILSLVPLFLGVSGVQKIKIREAAASEALKAAQLIKNEIRYKRAPFYSLCEALEKCGFKYITAQKGFPELSALADKETARVFGELAAAIGTSDAAAQLEMCEECCERLSECEKAMRENSAEQIKVCRAMCVFLSLCIFIVAV